MISPSPGPNTHPDQTPDHTGTSAYVKPEYLVAIGASAGGLDALEKLVAGLAIDSDAAFVIIQHLSPDYKSMMDTLLARHTRMSVVVVHDNMPLMPNRIHLIPPGALMHVENDRLRLTPKEPRVNTLPVDVFFQSAARSWGQRCVGIILSGTGSDGTRGVLAVNESGGFSIAQDPSDAAFDGMPRSAISTGLIDEVLPVESIPIRLMAHVFRGASESVTDSARIGLPSRSDSSSSEAALAGILHLLQQLTGVDFREYKPATVVRRIERRMTVRQVSSIQDYLDLLKDDRTEAQTLGHEILIPVTSFFRDVDAFDILETQIIAPLVAARASGQPIRVWCAGVSTGEEPYSIAMLFLEAFETQKRWPSLKIFATDVDPINVESAASGSFPESIEAEISPERLNRFFQKRGHRYVVKNELRQQIVFARHNLLVDPPFTRMDLVVCRNTLIYFKPNAQSSALRRLHYALTQGAHLFLGPSESLADLNTDFKILSARFKLWQVVRTATSPLDLHRQSGPPMRAGVHTPRLMQARPARLSKNAIDLGFDSLLKRFGPPPSVLVNAAHELVHVYGDVTPFIKIRDGLVSLDIARMLLEPLVPIVSALFFKCAREGDIISSDVIRLHAPQLEPDGSQEADMIRLTAIPAGDLDGINYMLLVFETVDTPSTDQHHQFVDISQETADRIQALEHELAMTRENLQATIEELETANEELQATNEEMMASNEELQSSNEELQSVNEELNTVNAEYQEKIEILNRINADLDNLTKVVATSTLFVDETLALVRFSEEAAGIFRLRDSDLGRPLGDLNHSLDYPDLIDDLTRTLQTGALLEKRVSSTLDARHFVIRMLPYNIPSTAARGLVISLVEVTELHQAVERLQDVVNALAENVAVLDEHGTIVMVNNAWIQFARNNGNDQLTRSGPGDNYLQICQDAAKADMTAAQAYEGIRRVLSGQIEHFQMTYPCHSPQSRRWFAMYANRLHSERAGAVISHIDITIARQQQPDA